MGQPSFYPWFGFAPARAKGLEAPFPVPDEVFKVRELSPGSLGGRTGVAFYPPAFLQVLNKSPRNRACGQSLLSGMV